MSDNVVQTHGHCIHRFCVFKNLSQPYCRTQAFLNMNKIQVDFARDIIFRSGKGKSVNDYSDHVSDVIHFN